MTRTLIIYLTVLLPALSFAHSGGLDASGCHHNRRTGDYHCHRSSTATGVSSTARRNPSGRRAFLKSHGLTRTPPVGVRWIISCR